MRRKVRAPCPVCGVRMPTRIDVDDYEHEACPAGHYSYTFRYGQFVYKIGGESFAWPFRSKAVVHQEMEQRVQDAIEAAKVVLNSALTGVGS